jgi:phage tail protein X
MGDRQVTTNNDQCCGDEQRGQEDNNLTLTGICTENDTGCNNRTRGDENDPYIYYGGTDQDTRPASDSADQRYEGGRQVTLKRGDTFWKLSEQVYGMGKHPIEAIYAANGLYPKVEERNGRLEMTDPTYYAGKTYTMPDERDLDRLTKQYRARVEELGRSSDKRVGAPDEATDVKLIYGDTFSRLGRAKYGKDVPMEAIFEANGLKATYTERNGELCAKDPIYYAGKTYKMPAEQDIPDLVRRYWDRVGHPEKCPPEYRNGGGGERRDPYGDYGETDRGRQPEPPPHDDGGRYGDYGQTGRDRGCACGGGGCYSCRGPSAPPRDSGCACNGGGCYACRGPEAPPRDSGCACGGSGCGSCRGGVENRNDDVVYQEGYEDGYTDGLRRGRGNGSECGCGGAGCNSCGGGRRRAEQCGCGGAGCNSCIDNMRRSEPYIDEILYYQDRYNPDRIRWEEEQRQRAMGCRDCGGGGCQACLGYTPRRRVRQ